MINSEKLKLLARQRRHRRVRAKIMGTKDCPRLAVFRSNKHIYAQLIDDVKAVTLLSASDLKIKKAAKVTKSDLSKEVGKLLATQAKEHKIECVVFDRGGYRYHGRIKAVADGAREGGLKF